MNHYLNDSAETEWLVMSANLEHVASGVCIEYRDGLITVDGVVRVDSLQNATELLSEVA
jgi:hypothetical protein